MQGVCAPTPSTSNVNISRNYASSSPIPDTSATDTRPRENPPHEISVSGHSCQDRPPDGSSKSGSPDVAGRVAIEPSELVSHSAHPLRARAEARASFGS